jgi:hypothetical protein
MISLVDIVSTGIEHHEWRHFTLHRYAPNADGVKESWATIGQLPSFATDPLQITLTADVIRKAVELYIDSRLAAGLPLLEAARLIDGSYTDVAIADSILQFALYGEEVYS